MICVRVPLLLEQNVRVLFGVLRGPRSDVPPFLAYSMGIIFVSPRIYLKFILCIPTCIVVMLSSCFLKRP
jgi:hypothetical protein